MGLALHDGRLLLACSDRVVMFADDPVLGRHYDNAQRERYDALYLPRLSWHAAGLDVHDVALTDAAAWRSEETTSELQSLMRTSYAVFCLPTKRTSGPSPPEGRA